MVSIFDDSQISLRNARGMHCSKKTFLTTIVLISHSIFIFWGHSASAFARDPKPLAQNSTSKSSSEDCKNSGPVCALPPMPPCPQGLSCAQVMPAAQTYDNQCEMEKAGAHFLHEGPCPENPGDSLRDR
jgi:hypothetical protein